MKWQKAKLAELFRVKHGFAFKSEFFDTEGPYALLTPGNFHESGGFRERGGKQPYYSGEVPSAYILDEGDLIVAMTEQEHGLLGSSAWVPESNRYLHNQRLGRIVDLDAARLHKRFLYYLFNTREVRAQISGSASGTKVRHTAPERIGRVEVNLPPLKEQQRIAEVLTAYDELMENNRRRMALLEEAARQLYAEWFVRMCYPRRPRTRRSAALPKGWTRCPASAVMLIRSGGTPRTGNIEYWDGDLPFYTPKDADKWSYVLDTERHISESGLASCNSQLYPKDTIFISARGTVGKLNLAQRPMAMSQSCYALTALEPLTPFFLFCAMRDAVAAFQQQAVGAVFDAIIMDTFERIQLLVPPKSVIAQFNEMIAPVFHQTENLQRQNQRLRAARDLLLPRLMSGEIAVSGIPG